MNHSPEQQQPGDSLVYDPSGQPMAGEPAPEAVPVPVPVPVPATSPEFVPEREPDPVSVPMVPAQASPPEPPYPMFPLAPPAPPENTSFTARAKPVLSAITAIWRRISGILIWAVKVAARLIAVVLLLHAAFTIFKANAANAWYQVIDSLAGTLSLGLTSLFQLADARWEALVNHGLAAVVWLAAGSMAAGLIRRLTP